MATDADLQLAVGVKLDDLTLGLDQAKGALTDFGSDITNLAALAGVSFSAEGLKSFISSMTELGSQAQAQAGILGTSAKDVEAIGLVAQDSGTSIDSMTTVLSRMTQNLERAEKGGGPVAFALQDIGLNAKSLLDMNVDDRIMAIANAFNAAAPSAAKQSDELQVLGLRGQQAEQFLKEFPSAIGGYKQAVEDSGTATQGFQDEANRMQPLLTKLGEAFKGAGEQIYTALGPSIERFVVEMTNLINSTSKAGTFAADMKTMGDSIASFYNVLKDNDVIGFLRDMKDVLDAITTKENSMATGGLFGSQGAIYGTGGLVDWLKSKVNQYGAPPDAAPQGTGASGSWDSAAGGSATNAATSAITGATTNAATSAAQAATSAASAADAVKAVATSVSSKPADTYGPPAPQQQGAAAATPKAGAAATSIGATSGVDPSVILQGWADLQDAQIQSISNDQREIASAQQTFAEVSAKYTEEAALKQITEQQKFAYIQQALQQELAAEQGAVDKELAIDNQSTQAKDAEMKEQQAIVAAAALKEINTNNQSLQQQQQVWSQYTNFVTGQMQEMLQTTLQGTINWQLETRKILQDLILFFAQIMEKWVSTWAAGQLANLTATTSSTAQQTAATLAATSAQTAAVTTGAAAQAAAKQAGAASSIGADISSILSSIGASIGSVIAGVSAFLAPVLGPAAPAAGIAAGATVQAAATAALGAMGGDPGTGIVAGPGGVATALPGFAIGAWNLPSDIVGQLHQGEMVVPTSFAEGFRNRGGSGGSATHIHLHNAIGTREWFDANSDYIAASVQKSARNFNRNLRAR